MKTIKFFYDLETTGLDYRKHGIHQIAGYIEVDNEIVEEINLHVRPHPKAIIDPSALAICKVTEEQILGYPDMKDIYNQLINILSKYVDRYNKMEKMFLIGYNNRSFYDDFFRSWFEQNDDAFFFSCFWPNTLDVMVLATEYLLKIRPFMPSFKLSRVAHTLGIGVIENKLHDSYYDVYLTREIYRIINDYDLL